MKDTIIEEAEFKAGEYGELLLIGHPVIEELFVDFYPTDVFPVEIGAVGARRVVDVPPKGAKAKAGKASRAAASADGAASEAGGVEELAATAEEGGVDVAGLEAAFGEPNMELYWSNNPRFGWKLVGEFKLHSYHNATRKACCYLIVHPEGCPFDGRVAAVAK